MRILRVPNDYRVVEQFGPKLLQKTGNYRVYNITKRGMTTGEVSQRLAAEAGVDPKWVSFTGQKAKEGVAGQVCSVLGGNEVRLMDQELSVRAIGKLDRALENSDVTSNAFEIVVRDLKGDDMRRIRHNMAQIREGGVPAYFDDQRFGCLRHGQGFVVRELLKGRVESAIRSMIAAPSPYGPDLVEAYKFGLRKRWGNWEELASYSKGRRGQSLFAHLAEKPDDFEGAMRMGFATRERTIHLFAYQSHIWNRALALWIRRLTEPEELGWLPCDEGSLPVFRKLSPEAKAELAHANLPLPGIGATLDDNANRLYKAVFEAEGIDYEAFLDLDIPGFRPTSEPRPVLIHPEYLRAAPAENDELYPRGRKMRVRFTLGRGHYSTLVLKRLMMPTNLDAGRVCMWVSRHPMVWPMDDGTPQFFEAKPREEGADNQDRRDSRDDHRGPRGGRGDFHGRRDDNRGDRGGYRGRPDDDRGGYRGRPDDDRGGYRGRQDENRDRSERQPSAWEAKKKWGSKSSKYGRGEYSNPNASQDRQERQDRDYGQGREYKPVGRAPQDPNYKPVGRPSQDHQDKPVGRPPQGDDHRPVGRPPQDRDSQPESQPPQRSGNIWKRQPAAEPESVGEPEKRPDKETDSKAKPSPWKSSAYFKEKEKEKEEREDS